MATNDYLPFGTGAGANVMAQADYVGLSARVAGFSSGVAKSIQLNKVWRQSSVAAAMIAKFTSDKTTLDVLDDGDVAAFEGKFSAAVGVAAGEAIQALPGTRGLRAQNNDSTPNTQFDISADMVAVRSPSSGATKVFSPVAGVTTNLLTAGPAVNGRDQAAAFPASSWIHFYLISNGSTVASIASLAAPPTGPTMPAGYTMWAYVGAVYVSSGAALAPVILRGSWASYQIQGTTVSGGSATVETAISVATLVPPNALNFRLSVSFMAGSTDGSGNMNVRQNIACVPGAVYFQFQSGAFSTPITSQFYPGPQLTLPNLGQNYFYQLLVIAGSGPATTHVCTGYQVPNGGE